MPLSTHGGNGADDSTSDASIDREAFAKEIQAELEQKQTVDFALHDRAERYLKEHLGATRS